MILSNHTYYNCNFGHGRYSIDNIWPNGDGSGCGSIWSSGNGSGYYSDSHSINGDGFSHLNSNFDNIVIPMT